uniref:t-SNARE coiled-coil homology domain-containing protein n=2 Tax=Parascaris univalens TaxID=6257 RepID=A0A914ZCR0_PARUN
MSSNVDPSREVKDQIEQLLVHISGLFGRIERVGKDERFTSKEREWLLIEIRNAVRSVDWDLDDLEHTITLVERDPFNYGITPAIIADRRAFIFRSRNYIRDIREQLYATDTRFANPIANMASSSGTGSYRYTRLSDSPTSSERFVSDTLQKQQLIMRDQDEDLEKVGDSVHILKNMSHRIGNELEEQAIMLDELGTDIDRAGTKLDGVMKKIAKVTNMNDDKRQWTAIFVLSGILFFIIILFILL